MTGTDAAPAPEGTGPAPTAPVRSRWLAALRAVPVAPWSVVERPVVIAILALVALRASYYAMAGAGFFQDDFHFVFDTQEHGLFGSVQGDHKLGSRPGMWLHFNVIYGLAGDHPLVLFAIVTALNAVAAVLLYLVAARLLPGRWTAAAVALVWVSLANHTTITVWGAASQALMAVLLLLAGVLLLTDGRWIGAAGCLVASVLCYQVTIPLALLAPLLVPSARPLSEAARLKVALAVAVATLWLWLNPTYPTDLRVPDAVVLWRAHFGTGLFGSEDPPALLRSGVALFVLAAVVVCAVAWVRGDRSWASGPSLVLAGVAVVGLGLVHLGSTPEWVIVGDHGWVDRLYAASSVGSAMVLVGIGQFLWRRQRWLAVGGAAVLVMICVYGQGVALGAWSRAGRDVVALMDELTRVSDEPRNTQFAVGPARPERNGVYALDSVAATYALYLAHGKGDGSVFVATIPTEFGYAVRQESRVPVEWPAFVEVGLDELPKLGALDVLAQGPGGLYLNGWAVRPGTRGPAEVGVFVDGSDAPWGVIPSADLPREDLERVRGFGPDHGFDQVLTGPPLAAGERSVCVSVLDVPRPHGDLDCRTVTIRHDPVVHLVSAEAVDDGVQLIGWAIDPATADPAGVVVTVDGGPEIDLGPVANERGDVGEAWPGYGLFHGFDRILPAPPGPHQVCLWAVGVDGTRSPDATCVEVPGS